MGVDTETACTVCGCDYKSPRLGLLSPHLIYDLIYAAETVDKYVDICLLMDACPRCDAVLYVGTGRVGPTIFRLCVAAWVRRRRKLLEQVFADVRHLMEGGEQP